MIIVKQEHLASTDEPEVMTNMSGGSAMGKTKGERIVKAKNKKGATVRDNWETLSNKSSCRASIHGGS